MNTINILNQKYPHQLTNLQKLHSIKVLLRQLNKMEINQDAWITKLTV